MKYRRQPNPTRENPVGDLPPWEGKPFMGLRAGQRILFNQYAGRGMHGAEYRQATGTVRIVNVDSVVVTVAGDKYGARPVVVNDANFISVGTGRVARRNPPQYNVDANGVPFRKESLAMYLERTGDFINHVDGTAIQIVRPSDAPGLYWLNDYAVQSSASGPSYWLVPWRSRIPGER